jgi:hypothetical protein
MKKVSLPPLTANLGAAILGISILFAGPEAKNLTSL